MNRPKVTVHSVASVDGRITVAPGCLLLNGDPRWLALAGSGDDAYRHVMAEYRPQVILEGSGSLVLDETPVEPLPEVEGDVQVLFQDFLPESVVDRAGVRGWFVVVDSGGRVRWFYKEFPGEDWAGWHLLVLVSRKTPPEYLAYLRREMIPYLVVGDERVDLPAAMDRLDASPSTMARCGTGRPLTGRPSTSARSGGGDSCASARAMARCVARRMFSVSISSTEAAATPMRACGQFWSRS